MTIARLPAGPLANVTPYHSSPAGAAEPGARLLVSELDALRDVDVVAGPDALDPTFHDAIARSAVPFAAGLADELRLPPPPVRSTDGYALYAALGRAVERFGDTWREPVAASAGAVAAEAKMMTLLKGIHGLEQEIRTRMSNSARV